MCEHLIQFYFMEVTIRPAAGRILTKPGMMPFLFHAETD